MAKIVDYIVCNGEILIEFDNGLFTKYYPTQVAEAFKTYGGSFVSSLARPLLLADRENTIKILTTWENYVREYIERFLYTDKTI